MWDRWGGDAHRRIVEEMGREAKDLGLLKGDR
jgi:hypothetical protein